MTLQHEIKIASFILPVVRIMPDESVIVESDGRCARFIPGLKKLIYTDQKGKIQSIKV